MWRKKTVSLDWDSMWCQYELIFVWKIILTWQIIEDKKGILKSKTKAGIVEVSHDKGSYRGGLNTSLIKTWSWIV